MASSEVAALPPLVWQSDVFKTANGNSHRAPAAQFGNSSSSRSPGADQVSETYRHVKQIADVRRDFDLYDLLSATRREETYQPYLQGWPSLLKSLSPSLFDLPAMVQEKYRTCQTMCFCGLFPQIKRAWASIDNSLFIWRYDKSGDVPVEYCGEEQAICAVGLAKPRPGVFLEAIQYILVLCTTTEIVLLGVCPTRRGTGYSLEGPAMDDIALQPLPMYSLPSDNVIMTCVASSSAGRVFLGGSDGHLYEIMYSNTDSWRKKRCQKVRITGSLQQYLPSFIPSLLRLKSPTSISKLVVDNERHILYSLSEASAILVFDLGAAGKDPAKKVGEVTDFVAAANSATNGRDVFRQQAGDKKASQVKHIAPVATSESQKLHLVAVTADGRRVYFTTQHLRYSPYYLNNQQHQEQRPTTLTAVFARPAPPQAGVAIGRIAADLTRPGALEVVAAIYAHGTLLLSEAVGSDGRTTKLLAAPRNNTLPPLSVNVGASSNQPGLREVLTELDNFIPGETCAIEASPLQTLLGPEALRGQQDELYSQIFSEPPRFALISTAGVVELEKRRPVDILREILEERSADKLRQFFEAYGPAEAAAMCFILATAKPGEAPAVAVREASAALENLQLVGEPRLPEDIVQPVDVSRAASSSGIYMGQAVNPNPEPDWSAAHRGLCLYLARMLQPVWEMRLFATAMSDPQLLRCRLSMETMSVLIDKLRCLDAFLQEYLDRRQQRGYNRYSPARPTGRAATVSGGGLFGGFDDAGAAGLVQQAAKRQRLSQAAVIEDDQTRRVRALAAKACEAVMLLQMLSTHNVGRLAARLDEQSRRTLKEMTLRDLVYESNGEAIASKLVSVLVTDHLDLTAASVKGPTAGVEEVVQALRRNCPSYFKEADRTFYQASAKLKQAESVTNPVERESLTREAVEQLKRVPLACNLEFIVSQLAYLRYYEGIVEIPLAAAAAIDPENLALHPELRDDCEQARQRRRECYNHVIATLRTLINPAASSSAAPGGAAAAADNQQGLSPAERTSLVNAILTTAIKSKDLFFHHTLYGALIDIGASSKLLSLDPPHLDGYLKKESGLASALEPRAGAGAAGAGAVAAVNGAAAAAAVGPLSRRQVQLGELLAKYYIGKSRFKEAAGVYAALAARRSGPGEQGVSIDQRVEAYQQAALQARSHGDTALVDKMDADHRLMVLQRAVAGLLQARKQRLLAGQRSDDMAAEISEIDRQLEELNRGLLDVSELYNDYAQPLKMWDVCLQLVNFAGPNVDPSFVSQLWDHYLIQVWEQSASEGGAVQLAKAAAAVEQLGSQFYPNENSFPLAYVTFRLEQMAAGLWPEVRVLEQPADETVVRALHGACKGALQAVQRTYELLLARRAPGISDPDLASSRLRTQLLHSLLAHCRIVQQDVTSALVTPGLAPRPAAAAATPAAAVRTPFLLTALNTAQREAGNLADACDRYALEARRLGTEGGEELAAELDAIKRQVEQRR